MSSGGYQGIATSFETGVHSPKEVEKNNIRKKLIKRFAFIILVIVIGGVFCAFVMGLFLSSVKFSFSGIASEQVKQYCYACADSFSLPYSRFSELDFSAKLMENSSIDTVDVRKKFPNMVFVNIKEVEPVAFTVLNVNGRQTIFQIDKRGKLFSEGKRPDDRKIPFVTGFIVEHPENGKMLLSTFRPLFEQIAELNQLRPGIFSAISEIRVIAKDYGYYELEMFPVFQHARVLLDRSWNENVIDKMFLTLDVVKDFGFVEVDLRYGSVSCNF